MKSDSEAAIEAAFAAIEQVHSLMSAHEPDSELSRINRFAHLRPIPVHRWTAEVLERAQFWSKESDGAFDVVRAGRLALKTGYLPRHTDQPEPLAMHWSELQVGGEAITLARPGCVDLGGIAKGFAVDKAIEATRALGSEYALVNAGGDLAGFGREWTATIVEPHGRRAVAEVSSSSGAIATSALQPDGGSIHLPDRDERYVSATVQAPSCIDADALAKVLLSGVAHCLSLVGAEGLLISSSGRIEAIERLAA